MMKKITALCVLLFMMTSLCACGGTQMAPAGEVKSTERPITIGMSFDSFVIERWQRDRDVFVSTAKDYGAEVNVQSASGDLEKQKEQIEYFIKKEVDVIVIICIDSDSLKETIQKAKDAGIKIIAYDRLLKDANIDLYISFDNEMVGTLMGEALVAQEEKPQNVIIIGGSPTDSNVEMVERGFRNVMDANAVNILDETHADGWRAEVAAEYIYANEELVAGTDAIMCGNDNLAGQAVHALAENRMAGTIAVTGQDAELEACQRIVEGTQLMTVYKPVEKLAKRAAECAIAMAKGEPLSGDDVGTINDGTYDIPYIGMSPIAVTKDNIDEVIIESGFHLKEDVYMNIP